MFAKIVIVLSATQASAVNLRGPAQPFTGNFTGTKCKAARAALLALGDAPIDKYVCQVSMSDRTEKIVDGTTYFTDLHKIIVDGNGHGLQGCLNGSSQEHYVDTFEQELQCLFTGMVEDQCGKITSKSDSRQADWEKTCLNPEATAFDAYELMDGAEKAYFRTITEGAKERQVYATFMELASYKELACIFMKTVDDDCVAFSKPRMLPPSYWRSLNSDELNKA